VYASPNNTRLRRVRSLDVVRWLAAVPPRSGGRALPVAAVTPVPAVTGWSCRGP
jgi:hypothetical protein